MNHIACLQIKLLVSSIPNSENLKKYFFWLHKFPKPVFRTRTVWTLLEHRTWNSGPINQPGLPDRTKVKSVCISQPTRTDLDGQNFGPVQTSMIWNTNFLPRFLVKIFLKRFKKQNIILSLIQQLSVDLKQDSAIKYRYLQDAVLSLGKVPGRQ